MKLVQTAYQRTFFFIRNYLTRPQYITLIAVITGLVSGLVAVLLKIIVHYLQKSFSYGEWYYLLLPASGLLLIVFVEKYFFKNILSKGIAMVLKAIAKKSSYIPTSNIYKHVITSSLTV